MAIQRVPGQMLEPNLLRTTDLDFSSPTLTGILHLDVSNNRVGIKTDAPGNFALDVNGTAHFRDSVSITGDLTVTGQTTVVSTTNMEIEDNILVLNSGGSTGNDAGIMINRNGIADNAVFYWDEVDDKFKFVITPSDGSTVTSVDDSILARIAVATPIDGDDAVTKTYVDSQISAGATDLGTFTFAGNKLTQTASDSDFEMDMSGSGKFVMLGTSALKLPSGTTAQRPSPIPGVIRFNTTTSQYEVSVDGSSWQALKTQAYTRTVTKDVFAGDGSTHTFTSANVATDAENLLVYIDGVIQEPDINYTIDIPASTITITDEAPHSGARVVVIRGFAEDVALS